MTTKTPTATKHACMAQGADGALDMTCPRCQEMAVAKAVRDDPTATVTIGRAQRPDLPPAERPVQVTESLFPTAVKKRVEPQEDGSVIVTYDYLGKSYHGCLSFQRNRVNGQGAILGTEVFYVLYPTVEQRDAAYAAREDARRQQEAQRMELRRIQATEMTDLIGPNGLPMQAPGLPAVGYGGQLPQGLFPPMRDVLQG